MVWCFRANGMMHFIEWGPWESFGLSFYRPINNLLSINDLCVSVCRCVSCGVCLWYTFRWPDNNCDDQNTRPGPLHVQPDAHEFSCLIFQFNEKKEEMRNVDWAGLRDAADWLSFDVNAWHINKALFRFVFSTKFSIWPKVNCYCLLSTHLMSNARVKCLCANGTIHFLFCVFPKVHQL